MSGKNVSIFDLPPGINRMSSQSTVGKAWYDGNLVRWFANSLMPIGGWVTQFKFSSLAEQALSAYTTGIAFSFLDGSLVIKSGGVVKYSGPMAGKATIFGTVEFSRDGAYLDQSNYVSMRLDTAGVTDDYSTENTLLSEWNITSYATTNSQTAVWFGSRTTRTNNHRHEAYFNFTTSVRVVVQNPSIAQMNKDGVPWPVPPALNTSYRLASAYKVNNGNAVLNNLSQTLDTTIVSPTGMDIIYLGRNDQTTNNGLRGNLKTVVMLPVRLIDADLATWSNLPPTVFKEPIRDTHSWRDLLKAPWAVYGSANGLFATSINADGSYTPYTITPAGLGYNPGGLVGYGSGLYGKGVYGVSIPGTVTLDSNSQWSLDNFGSLLVGVASQDGRLVVWDPTTPATVAQVVPTAPVDNTLVITTDEEFLMVMGGKHNPRKVKWPSQRTYTDWTPTGTNTAGGFDLHSNGTIIGACRVPGGILVLTDTDAHLIEFIGAPYYYAPRRLSDEGGLVAKNALSATPFGAIWMGSINFWTYNGVVDKLVSTVENEAFYLSNLTKANLVHSGINQFAQEVWFFFPTSDSTEPNRYVAYSYNQNKYWTLGYMTRTAWLNPVWQVRPVGVYNQILYQQETGLTADGTPRSVYAESGFIDIQEGTNSYRVDRVYPDIVDPTGAEITASLNMSFKRKQAPNAPIRPYGPFSMHSDKGYVVIRMRARQISMKVEETVAAKWVLGNTKLRIKDAGSR